MDLTPEQVEILTKLLERLGLTSDLTATVNKEFGKLNKNLTDAQKQQLKSKIIGDELSKKFKELNEQLTKERKKYIDLGGELKNINELLEDMGGGLEKEALAQQRHELASKHMSATLMASAKQIATIFSGTAFKSISKVATGLVADVQNGSSGVAMAADILTAGIDATQGVFKGVTDAGKTAGDAMILFGGKRMKILGGAVEAVSIGLDLFTGGLAEVTKVGIRLMVAEVERTVKAFNSAATVGALFADGMGGMRLAARDSGLSLQQFSNALVNNSVALSESGLTVGEAAKKMGAVGKVMGGSGPGDPNSIQTKLLRLGYGFEEQAGLVAEVMATMRRSNQLASATDPQIAAATEKYATNLRILSNITGEDAKAAVKASEAKNRQYAFDAKLREAAAQGIPAADIASLKATVAVIDKYSAEAGDAFRQMYITSNDVSNGFTNIAGVKLAGLDKVFGNMIYQFNHHNSSQEVMLNELSQGTAMFRDNISASGVAAGKATQFGVNGVANEYAKAQSDIRSLAIAFQDPNKALQTALGQRETADKATNEYIAAERAAQDTRLKIENELTNHLAGFVHVQGQILTKLNDILADMDKDIPTNANGGRDWATAAKGFGEIAAGALLTYFTGGLGSEFGVPLMLYGAGTASEGLSTRLPQEKPKSTTPAPANNPNALTDVFGNKLSDQIPKFDVGGIARGPKTGFFANLHGSEAVVPLPDGKTIPVNLDGFNFDLSPVQQQLDQLAKAVGKVQDDAKISKIPTQIIATDPTSGKISDTLQKQLELTKLVATNTKNDGLTELFNNLKNQMSDANTTAPADGVADLQQSFDTAISSINEENIAQATASFQRQLEQIDTLVAETNRELSTRLAKDTPATKEPITVNVDNQKVVSALTQQSAQLDQILRAMLKTNNLTSGILQNSY